MNRCKFPKRNWILVMVMLFVIGCGSSGAPAVVTQVVVVQPTKPEAPNPVATATVNAQPAEESVAATLTTESGMTIRLPELNMGYHCGSDVGRDSKTLGILTRSGVDVAWKYVRRLEVGEQSEDGVLPVRIELVNGDLLETSLGILGFSLYVKGKSDLGDFESLLTDLKEVSVEHSQPVELPGSPPEAAEGPSATVQVGDASVPVSGLSFYKYSCDTNWIPAKISSENLYAVPLASGLKVDLAKVTTIQFGEDADQNLQVTIQTIDGQTVTDKLPYGEWRMRGQTSLGEYDLYLSRSLLPITVTIAAP